MIARRFPSCTLGLRICRCFRRKRSFIIHFQFFFLYWRSNARGVDGGVRLCLCVSLVSFGVSERAGSPWTALATAHFKFSTHPGWLWQLVPLLQGRLLRRDTQQREDLCRPRLQAVNLLWKSNYVYIHTHTETVCTPPLAAALPPPAGNKAPSVSLQRSWTQLLSGAAAGAPGQDRALWPGQELLLLLLHNLCTYNFSPAMGNLLPSLCQRTQSVGFFGM